MSTPAQTPTPGPAPDRGPDRSTLVHRIATCAIGVAFVGYVLHKHPAYRETAAALAAVGTLALALVVAVVGRRR
ncbi:hypothetical protein AB0E71_28370 [Streptomyces narbonensis]|uniref:hypothetical protein n=1 Tax=Streptomyces narbonensis TaxID=67333 RepID=UPI003402D63E